MKIDEQVTVGVFVDLSQRVLAIFSPDDVSEIIRVDRILLSTNMSDIHT